MTDEMKKQWVCPRCDQDSTNESGPCDECIESVANDLSIPESVVKEYALDIGDYDLSNIEEAYSGEYSSDKQFAQDIADQLGTIEEKNMHWPHSCIDWDHAASELMMDYFEIDGYYFRHI